jgi:hypothetical protein
MSVLEIGTGGADTSMKPAPSLGEKLYRMLAAVPVAALGIVLIEAAYLRLRLGRWPVYPENVGGPVVLALTLSFVLLLWATLLGSPVMLLVPLGHIRNGRWRQFLPWSALFVAGIAAIVLATAYDPTTFFDWFWD